MSYAALRDILEQAARRTPERIYFRGPTRSASYRATLDESRSLARFVRSDLQVSGMVPLGVSTSDPVRLLHVVWACIAADVRLAFLPACRNRVEMHHMMEQAGARILLTDIPELAACPWAVSFEALDRRLKAFEQATAIASPTTRTDPGGGAFLLQTSGTSGEPRWVVCRYESCLRVLDCMRATGSLDHAVDRTVFLTIPVFHSYGLSALLEYTSANGTLVFPSGESRFGPVGELNAPRVRDTVDAIEGVPYFYEQLASIADRVRLPETIHFGFGGGAVSALTTEALRERWPRARYSLRYGLTETPSVVSHKVAALDAERDPRAAGSIPGGCPGRC